ncbi:hypothetical protein [Spirosoma endophyticum]|uniref:Uncharacterized protein n=1 Tax=Spirosoma endophyticum TaxID=662367 RepID=A0A1I1ZQS3_9BACT|nr:hypothetical protein [Spirosoma endophyticum]SFE32953.1 hypothetical protein SAMN05216167_112165 [Spirosoma endophyticum]
MKIVATLVGLLIVTASFAQQNSVKEISDSLQNQTIDNMPILKGQGNALDMPTRNGKGDAIPMPNRSMPVALTSKEQVSVSVKAKSEPVTHWSVDSLFRVMPTRTQPKKN